MRKDQADSAADADADAESDVAPEPAMRQEVFPEAALPGPYSFRPVRSTPSTSSPVPGTITTQVDRLRDTSAAAAWTPPAAEPPAAAAAPAGSGTMARIGEELVAWFKTLVSAAVYATLIVTFGFQVARVEGESMAPTLENQDRLIVNKLAYRLHDPQIGDIVMLYYPVDPDKSFVKRIIAEPLDTIKSDGGQLYRNGIPLPDDFIPEEYKSYDTWGPRTVEDGYYFVMGDHRKNSSDSRTWGFVPKKYIIGKVQLRWWPLDHARIF